MGLGGYPNKTVLRVLRFLVSICFKMTYFALHSCVPFADRRVTGQIGVTSRTALRGAAYDDRTTVFSLEGLLPANRGRSLLSGVHISTRVCYQPQSIIRLMIVLS